MKNLELARTLLSVYNHLEHVADSIDKMIEASAVGSFYVSSSTFQKFGVEAVVERIINLSSRKVTMINLKVLVENALSHCRDQSADILSMKFFEKKSGGEIIAQLHMPERTYFRKLDGALKEFACNLERLGFGESDIFNLIKGERWIMRVYEEKSANLQQS